ncbi:MAG: hypothetical protein AAFV72_00175 [Cyanobacteria bacterium J06635_1]
MKQNYKRVRAVLNQTGHSWAEARELRDELKLPPSSRAFTAMHCASFRDLLYADWAASLGLGNTNSLRDELWLVIANSEANWLIDDDSIWSLWESYLTSGVTR